MSIRLFDVQLTWEEHCWFNDRMDENSSGQVRIKPYCYPKFRKIVDNPILKNWVIKDWLIENVYNSRRTQ